MRAIYVPLRDDTLARLVEAARRERRHPRDQAALFLEQRLALEAPESLRPFPHPAPAPRAGADGDSAHGATSGCR